MTPRIIEARDLPELFELRGTTRENPYSREALRSIGITEESTAALLQTTSRGWLCESGAAKAGFAIGDGKTGEMCVVAVSPQFEDQGVGSCLLAAVEDWLFSLGWKELWLWTSADPGKRAYSFYIRRGWFVSETKGDTVVMKKHAPREPRDPTAQAWTLSTPGRPTSIRRFKPEDDVEALTAMLHRAYAPLAALGLRYNATHQTPEATRRRLLRGHPFVAAAGEQLVGTITAYGPDPESQASAYRRPDTFHFGQFGVDPDFKGRGIGRALHAAMTEFAIGQGAKFMALDTAAPAAELIALYERWGYSVAERARWASVNYESVIMVRALVCAPTQSKIPAADAGHTGD